MEINNISNMDITKSTQNITPNKPVNTEEIVKTEQPKDTIAYHKPTKTYEVDGKKIQSMIKESEEKTNSFRKMLEKLFNKQAKTDSAAQGISVEDALKNIQDKISKGEEVTIEIDAETQAQAKEDISEDGYYGVKKTSERILDFAKALSNNNPEVMEKMKDAFIKGFKSATDTWGDKLPQISQDTYKAVMDGFDTWKKENDMSNKTSNEITAQSEVK